MLNFYYRTKFLDRRLVIFYVVEQKQTHFVSRLHTENHVVSRVLLFPSRTFRSLSSTLSVRSKNCSLSLKQRRVGRPAVLHQLVVRTPIDTTLAVNATNSDVASGAQQRQRHLRRYKHIRTLVQNAIFSCLRAWPQSDIRYRSYRHLVHVARSSVSDLVQ